MRFPLSDHCDGRRFHNPSGSAGRSWLEVLRWKLTSRAARWPRWVDIPHGRVPPAPTDDTVIATWVNHATVLLRTRACTLLVDPVWSDRVGPFGRIGPRRVHAPGIRWTDLPPIDLVLLTHDHYDHADLPTMRRLASRFPTARLVAPLGHADLARRSGFHAARLLEMDWWQSRSIDAAGLQVQCLPAFHWSNRLSSRRNGRLWCGFGLRTGARTVYVAGDTAYDPPMTAKIALALGAVDLAILPVGCYEPRWFMQNQHCNPEEAALIHGALRARCSLGVHWGTFSLTDESRLAPVEEVMRVADATFRTVAPGESLTV